MPFPSLSALLRAQEGFRANFNSTPSVIARSPGRVNLIGEHTDYNEGFVLPIALPFDTVIAASPHKGSTVTVHSEGFGTVNFDLDRDPSETPDWARYLHGVGVFLRSTGKPISGWTGYIASDIPSGANLASSAALEIAAGLIFCTLSDVAIDPKQLARCGQHVENHIFGLPSGIMDQWICSLAKQDQALLIDCRTLSTEPVKIPEEVALIIMDTGTRRDLTGTEYANRRATCKRVATELNVTALRDATLEDLAPISSINATWSKRARHVISENNRTLKAFSALQSGDSILLGKLMVESHRSLATDYEVSSPALNKIVDTALENPDCLGARMTGGGFAGCAVALVKSENVDHFCDEVSSTFTAPDTQPAVAPTRVYPVRAAAGASII
ncbi:MAG: galactokinase [Acidimicrobiales bacterium]|nr:galactokinase [Acidimicrobiales bacterium]